VFRYRYFYRNPVFGHDGKRIDLQMQAWHHYRGKAPGIPVDEQQLGGFSKRFAGEGAPSPPKTGQGIAVRRLRFGRLGRAEANASLEELATEIPYGLTLQAMFEKPAGIRT